MANDLVTVWGGVPRIGRAPASNELLVGNGSGFTLQTVAITLDNILGSTQGSIAYRSATQWTQLTPGTSGFLLQTNGASNNPSWVSLGTAFNNYFGTTTGAFPVYTGSTWGTLTPGPVGTIVVSDGSLPAYTTLTNLLDVTLTNQRQALITRGASQWTFLSPTTTPYLLLTNNTGNASSDVGWTTFSNAIDNGTTGSATIGDLIYRGSASYQKLTIGAANTIITSFNPGSGNIPAWKTVSELFDSYFSGYGVGSIITRDRNAPNGSGLWGALTIGATNTLLTSASATGGNLPQWTTLSSAIDNGAAGTTFLGSMLYAASGGWTKLTIGVANTILTSSGGTAPAWSTTTSNLDATMGSTVGGILYRASSGSWANSGVGTAGQILQTNGASANPSWVTQWRTLFRSSNQSITSTAFADDTQLQFSVTNGQSYLIEFFVLFSSDASGYIVAVNGPFSSVIMTCPSLKPIVNAANTTIEGVTGVGNSSILVSGVFTANASGTFAVRHALFSSGGTASVSGGSWLRYYLV